MTLRPRKKADYKEPSDNDFDTVDDVSHSQSANIPPFYTSFVHLNWSVEQQKDSVLLDDVSLHKNKYHIQDSVIYKISAEKIKKVVPLHLVDSLISSAHGGPLSNHPGTKGTMYLLRMYWFPSFRTKIRNFIKSCRTCILAKPPKTNKHFQTRQPALPLERLSIDIKAPLPISPDHWQSDKRYILTIVDESSKFLNAVPTSHVTASHMVYLIKRHWIQIFGPPTEIIVDNGSQFLGNDFEQFIRELNITLSTTAPFAHFQNPVERCHRELDNKIRAIKHSSGVSWAESQNMAVLSINNTMNSSTTFSPISGSQSM